MATQWPRVVARLLTLLPTLPGWSAVAVYDGLPITLDTPTDYITVGYVANQVAGAYTTVQDPNGFQWAETGTVEAQLNCTTGDSDLPGMRARVFALADALDASIRADRTLGGTLSPAGTSGLDVTVDSLENSAGTAMSLLLTLYYQTVT